MWELDYKKSWVPKNWCFWTVVLEKTLKSPLDCKEIQPVHPKGDWCWGWNSNTLATWCKELSHWKRSWCWERLKAGGEGDDRGWNGLMTSPTQWAWVWASSRNWWWTGKPGMLQSMGSQRVRHDWVTELNWTHWGRIRQSYHQVGHKESATTEQLSMAHIIKCWMASLTQCTWVSANSGW